MSEANKAISRRIVEELWNRKNPTVFEELFDTECVLHTPDGTLRGLDGCRQFYERYVSAFPDCQLVCGDLIAEGDRVVVPYTFTGTQKGNLMDITATGKQVEVKGVNIARLNRGKVVEEWLLWDTLSAMEQIDAVPMHEHAWR